MKSTKSNFRQGVTRNCHRSTSQSFQAPTSRHSWRNFARFLRLSGLNFASDLVKTDWLAQACEPENYKITTNVIKETGSNLEETLKRLGEIFPTLENVLTIRRKIESLPTLGYAPEPQVLASFLLEFETLSGKLSAHAWTDQDKLLSLIGKLHPKTFQEIRAHPFWRSRTDTYQEMKSSLQEKVKEDWIEKKMSNPKLQVLALDDVMQVDQVPSQSSSQGQVAPQNRGRTKGQAQSSGKGKGKSKGTGRGNSRSTSRIPSQNRFSATIVCKFCNKTGH